MLEGWQDKPELFDARVLIQSMDSFLEFFQAHLDDEIAMIQGLFNHPAFKMSDSKEIAILSHVFQLWRANTIKEVDYRNGIVPFLLMNHDSSGIFDNGKWPHWSLIDQVPWWAFKSADLFGWFHHGPVWRFASCNIHGRPQDLYAFEGPGEWDAKAFRVLLTVAALLCMHNLLSCTMFRKVSLWRMCGCFRWCMTEQDLSYWTKN